MRSAARWRALLWISHVAVLLAMSLGIVSADIDPIGRAVLAAAAAAPLLLAVPGLQRRRRSTYQWLTVALVLYIGIASVEVVATLGQARFGIMTLFAALLELGVLLHLIREPQPAADPPAASRG